VADSVRKSMSFVKPGIGPFGGQSTVDGGQSAVGPSLEEAASFSHGRHPVVNGCFNKSSPEGTAAEGRSGGQEGEAK